MAQEDTGKVRSRYYFTSEEMQMLEMFARRYSLSKTAYVEAALNDVADKKYMVMIAPLAKREAHIDFKLDRATIEKAKKDAVDMNVSSFPNYFRQRVLGGVSFPAPVRPRSDNYGSMSVLDRFDRVMGISKAGRRRNSEILMEIANGSLLRALLLDTSRMKTFIETIFQRAVGAGIEPGDIVAVLDFLECLMSAEIVRTAVSSSSEHSSDPDVIQASRSKRKFVVWTALHGRVLAEKPPQTERRSDYLASVRKMKMHKG